MSELVNLTNELCVFLHRYATEQVRLQQASFPIFRFLFFLLHFGSPFFRFLLFRFPFFRFPSILDPSKEAIEHIAKCHFFIKIIILPIFSWPKKEKQFTRRVRNQAHQTTHRSVSQSIYASSY